MSFFKQTISSVPLEGKTVLVRTDYNVPLESDGSIADDFRIQASLPTIQKLLSENCKVVIISHLGRPEGREEKYSLEQVAGRLATLLGESVRFINETTGDRVRMGVKRAPKRSVTVLENLRYYKEEEANDADFAREIVRATGAKYFVQEGFGVVHRAHASTATITQELPAVAGLLLEKEYTTITKVMNHPDHPLLAVLGGAKVADKIELIKAFISVADTIVIGGAMANTFLAYKGYNVGKSKYEPDEKSVIDEVYRAAEAKVGKENINEFIMLPEDVAVGDEVSEAAERRTVAIDAIADGDIVLDAGEKTIEKITRVAANANTVVWNGAIGMTELDNFSHGSARLALALATNTHLTSVIGGGDTADFVRHWDAKNGASFTHVSTGGGASLELMAGEKLPGIESLLDARK